MSDIRKKTELEQLQEYCNNKILKGPFEGLHITPSEHWYGGDIMAKWLGTYEEPIHHIINLEISKEHDLFINVGCGDGYYGAGVGFKSNVKKIEFFDIYSECGILVHNLCEHNNIKNYEFSHENITEKVQKKLYDSTNPWMLVDIEGAEVDFLDLTKIPELSKTIIVVEMHDFQRDSATEIILERFSKTHEITNILDSGVRDLSALPKTISLSLETENAIITEKRPVKMNWLYMTPKSIY